MPELADRAALKVKRGLTVARAKSKETASVIAAKREIARIEKERRESLERLGAMVCDMVDTGRLDEAELIKGALAIAEYSERRREQERKLESAHQVAAAELEGGNAHD